MSFYGIPAADRAVTAYAAAVNAVHDTLEQWLHDLWYGLPAYHDVQAAEFVAQAVPVIQAAQTQAGSLTSAMVGLVGTTVTGHPVDIAVPPIVDVRQGISPEEVYRRPFKVTWTVLGKDGATLTQAVDEGWMRLRGLAEDDVEMTVGQTAEQIGRMSKSPRIRWWARVVADSKACDRCYEAAGTRYRTKNLLPRHKNCRCKVVPVFSTKDPGPRVGTRYDINGNEVPRPESLGPSKGARKRPEGDPNYAIVQHPELGAILVDQDHPYTPLQPSSS